MSMSTYVKLIRPADDRYHQMYALAKSCQEAGVSWPPEVVEYFGAHDLCDIESAGFPAHTVSRFTEAWPAGIQRLTDGTKEIFEVNLDALDASVRIIRFENSF